MKRYVFAAIARMLLVTGFYLAANPASAQNISAPGSLAMSHPNCDAIWTRTNLALPAYTDWALDKSAGVSATVTVEPETSAARGAIAVTYQIDPATTVRPQLMLRSAGLSALAFDDVGAISFSVIAGGGGVGRVILAGSDGTTFFSSTAVPLTQPNWTETRSTTSTAALVYFGDTVPDSFPVIPPFSVHHIQIGLPLPTEGPLSGTIRVSNIAIFQRSSLRGADAIVSSYTKWLKNNCNVVTSGQPLVTLTLPVTLEPVDVGSRMNFSVTVQPAGYRGAAALRLRIYRFGADPISLPDQALAITDATSQSNNLVYDFSSPGLYGVTASLVDANGSLLGQASRGVMVWAPPGNAYTDTVPSFFGMMYLDRFSSTAPKDLALMAKAGVKLIRFPFRWSEIETAKNQFSWTIYDTLMKNLSQAGFVAQPMVVYTPKWAGRDLSATTYASDAATTPEWVVPNDPADVARFLGAAARRYANQPVIWEVYNEATEGYRWIGGTGQDYVATLKAVSTAVRAASPTAKLIPCGIDVAGAMDPTFSPLVANNLQGIADAFAIHSYGGESQVATNIALIRNLLPAARKDMDLYVNETGYLVDPTDPTSELRRSAALVKAATVSRFLGAKNFIWFIFSNLQGISNVPTDNFPIMIEDGSVRPAIIAYANVVNRLAGSTPTRAMDFGPNARGYEFSVGDRRVLVTWLDEETGAVSIQPPVPVGMMLSEVYDMFGGPVDITHNDGSLIQRHSPLFSVFKPQGPPAPTGVRMLY